MVTKIWKARSYFAVAIIGVLFVWTTWLSFSSIEQLQGNARVINYVGIVRGATQRLVKQELRGFPNDALIARLDGIVNELIHGNGPNNLVALQDSAFQGNMAKVLQQWTDLKKEIDLQRKNSSLSQLYPKSEKYFELVDQTVSLAETYTESQVSGFNRRLKISSGVFVLLFLAGLIVSLRTVRLKRRAEMLGAIAFIDPLTKMPNRAACHRQLANLAQHDTAGKVAVFMFDMNNLKRVNDEFGHGEGDKIIAQFGRLLLETFGDAGFTGRYGGDEFVAFLRDCDAGEAERWMDTLRRHVAAYNESVADSLHRVQFSGGFSAGDTRNTSIDDLLKNADRNMYNQKRHSRESVVDSIMEQVADVSRELVQVASLVNSSSQELVDASERERSLFSELSVVTDTLLRHAEDYSRLAGDSSRAIVEIRESAENGDEDMRLLAQRMEEIAVNAREVHNVLKTIADISFQTKILSLNAAVEAARAGRYGKGFAVVAEEVRTLALRSSESVDVTNNVLDRSDTLVGSGVTYSRSTMEQLLAIVAASRKADKLMAEVATLAEEQQRILADIVARLSGVSAVARKNSSSAAGNAETARRLLRLANKMRHMLHYGMEVNQGAEEFVTPKLNVS